MVRLQLKKWCELEATKKKIDDAISTRDFDTYYALTVRTIEMASISLPKINWEDVLWIDVASAYNQVIELNRVRIDFPILRSDPTEPKTHPWEYEGRSWYFWLNLFSSRYGWDEDKISMLDVDTAVGLYQEISIDEQLQKEWEYGLSDVAYVYNTTTKSSEFKPLPRPDWMKPIIPKELPVIRMRKDMLPTGNIVNLEEKYG